MKEENRCQFVTKMGKNQASRSTQAVMANGILMSLVIAKLLTLYGKGKVED